MTEEIKDEVDSLWDELNIFDDENEDKNT